MTDYPKSLTQRFPHEMRSLRTAVRKLQARTSSIDSGISVHALPAVIDPAYSGTGKPHVLINGSTSLAGPYPVLGGYQPTAGDSVVVLPVRRSYVVLGISQTPPAWTGLNYQSGWGDTGSPNALGQFAQPTPAVLDLAGRVTGTMGGSGTTIAQLPSGAFNPATQYETALAVVSSSGVTASQTPRLFLSDTGALMVVGLAAGAATVSLDGVRFNITA